MDPVARILLVSLLVGALLKVKSLFLTLWQIYFLQCGSPFDIRTLGFMLLMVCSTLKLFRLSRKPAPSVNGGTWGFCLHFVYFFVTLLAFPQLSTSAKADVMAWRRLLASLPPRARVGRARLALDSRLVG